MGHCLRRCQHTQLHAGTWNVHSLREESGDCWVCITCGASRCGTTMERKVELLIAKLKNYNMSIAGIQETKWFGSDFWPCGEWTSLHSGYELPLPPDGIICTRQNGVGSVSLAYSIFPHLSNSSPRNSSPTVQQNSRICW